MSTGMVFGRPWLSGEADVLSGFDLGRLATALAGSEKITIVSETFSGFSSVFNAIPWNVLSKLFTNGTIGFLYHPESVGIITLNDDLSEIGAILIGEAIEIRQSAQIDGESLKSSFNSDFFSNVTMESDQAAIISNATRISRPGLQQQVFDRLGKDLLDLAVRPKLNAFFQSYFQEEQSVLDFIKVELNGTCVSLSIPKSRLGGAPVGTEGRVHTAALMLTNAYFQCAVFETEHPRTVYTDEIIFKLIAAASSPIAKKPEETVQSSLNTILDAIDLPDLGWMVNRSLLTINDIVAFHSSTEGKQFRAFIEEFSKNVGGANSTEIKEKLLKVIISSFHTKTWWEKNWDSKSGKILRLAATTGIGLVQGIGTVLSAATSIADGALDKAIPRNYRPTLVLEDRIKNHIDQEKLLLERKRKLVMPSLSKLASQGYEATMVFASKGAKATLILHVPGKEQEWRLGIDLTSPDCQEYLEEFMKSLPAPGTSERELVDALGDGFDMINLRTKFNNTGETAELSQEFLLKKGEEEKIVVCNTPEAGRFVMGRSCLQDPKLFAVFKKKIES